MRRITNLQNDAIITRFGIGLGNDVLVGLARHGMRALRVVLAYLRRLTGQVSARPRAMRTHRLRAADSGTTWLWERLSSHKSWLCHVLRPVKPACGASATRF
jgi:hypothetical protein